METNGFHDIFHKYFYGLQVVEERHMNVPKTIGMGENTKMYFIFRYGNCVIKLSIS